MRAIVWLLLLLAAAKVAYHEQLFRSSASGVIVAAYRDRAIQACQRESRGPAATPSATWASPQSIQFVIGKSNLDVQLWQVDHVNWNARYKNPYLVLASVEKGAAVTCEFDIVHGGASVARAAGQAAM